ncbi:hypothetical protein [Phytohabitans kaempferiae]|uniref:Uncharacterized protein n=1 Tax=Phytohabitans kaempferiae TaxID=1620943 RepID=A0ABV6M9H3_9ACTN
MSVPNSPGMPAYPQVSVRLSGFDGNAITIIGRVANQLRGQVSDEAADQFTTAAYACGSYDELLQLAMRTVDVS